MQKGFTIAAWVLCTLLTSNLAKAQGTQTVGMFTKNVGQQDGYVLFSPNGSYNTYMIDKCGKLVHKWNTGYLPGLDAFILPNGNLLSTGRLTNNYFSGQGSVGGLVQLFDWNNKLLWRYPISDSLEKQDHDVFPMANGNILVCVWERFTAAQATAMGRDSAKLGGSDLYSAKVEEIKPLGTDSAEIVWQWRLWDHLIQDHDSTKPNYGVVADHPELFNLNYVDTTVEAYNNFDWIHSNAVTYNADLDQVMISSRSASEVWIVDHNSSTADAVGHVGGKHRKGGDFLYRWGNPAAYNRGTKSDEKLFVQHNPTWIPDGFPGAGHILVFNDGTGRTIGTYSSADEFVPPIDSNGDYNLTSGKAYGPDTDFWSYTAPVKASFYSAIQGGAQRLSNGNTMICEATSGNFFEVDSHKNIVWRYVNPDAIGTGPVAQTLKPGNNTCFRANLYTEDFPGFVGKKLRPGLPIEVDPFSYNCTMPYLYPIVPLYNIAQLKGNNSITGVADSLKKGTGFIKGVVESEDLGSNTISFSLIDSTGAITISTDQIYYMPSIGDSIMVGGTVGQANGLTEYVADTIIVKSAGTWQKIPDVVGQLGEQSESDLITIKNVHLVDTTEWQPAGEGFDARITNGIDTFTMLVSSLTDLFSGPIPNEEFNITGIEIQDKPTPPYLGGYEIEPRGSFDIEKLIQTYTIAQVRVQDATTGISDSAGGANPFYLKGIVQSPDYSSIGLDFSLMDNTGAIMVIAATKVNGYTPKIGDSIVLRGRVTQFDGLTEILADSISLLANAAPQIAPVNVSELSENNEAHLVKLSAYHLLDTFQWAASGSGFTVDITNDIDTVSMYISSSTDLFKMYALQGPFNVTGIEIQNQPNAPYFGGYAIAPRGFFDIERYIELYKIRQVRGQNQFTGVADSAGSQHPFYLKGIVQSPDFTTSGFEFSIKDSTGSIFIAAASSINNYSPTVGDSVEIRGLLIQTNGVTGVEIDSISQLSGASPVLSPRVVKVLSEATEADLVKYDNAWILDPTQWTSSGVGFSVDITNGNDTIQLFISNATDLYAQPAPKGKFNVTGIGFQNKAAAPFIGNDQLMPRNIADLQFPPYTLYKIRDVKGYNAVSGIADSINTYCYLKGIVYSGNLSGKKSLFYALQDSTGAITITSNGPVNSYTPAVGDSIEVRGTVLQLKGLTYFSADNVSKLTPGTAASPVVVTSLGENTESGLVTLNAYRLIDASKWDTTGANGNFDVDAYSATDTITLDIVSGTDLYLNSAVPTGEFDVTGIGSQSDLNMPYFTGYYLIPRSLADFSHNSGFAAQNAKDNHVNIYPNPASGAIHISATFQITEVQVTDMVGKVLLTAIPQNGTADIDLSTLTQGIYLVKVFNGNNSQVEKIIKN